MAVRVKLTKSIMGLTILYWVIFAIAFVISDTGSKPESLSFAGHTIEYIPFFSDLNSKWLIAIQWMYISSIAILIALTASVVSVLIYNVYCDVSRKKRMKNYDEYRGMRVTLSVLPQPKKVKFEEINVNLPKAKLSKAHQALLNQILGTIKMHNVSAGSGHGVDLFEHTLNVLQKAIDFKIYDANTLCAIAAHDIGKISTFKKVNGKWVSTGKHDNEGAKILSQLPAWFQMDFEDRWIVLYAVKYSHKPHLLPIVMRSRAKIEECLEKLRHIDHNTTAEEKVVVVEQIQQKQGIWEALETFLREAHFRNSNTPVGKKTGGFIRNNMVFISEEYLKHTFVRENFPDLYASHNESPKQKGFYTKLSKAIIKEFEQKDLLVKEYKDFKAGSPMEARWDIKAGDKQFSRMLIIKLTEEIHALVGNITYHKGITILGLTNTKPTSGEKKTPPKARVEKKSVLKETLNKINTTTPVNEPENDTASANTPIGEPVVNHNAEVIKISEPNQTDKPVKADDNTAIKEPEAQSIIDDKLKEKQKESTERKKESKPNKAGNIAQPNTNGQNQNRKKDNKKEALVMAGDTGKPKHKNATSGVGIGSGIGSGIGIGSAIGVSSGIGPAIDAKVTNPDADNDAQNREQSEAQNHKIINEDIQTSPTENVDTHDIPKEKEAITSEQPEVDESDFINSITNESNNQIDISQIDELLDDSHI